jgi:hypothetical protein
MKSAFLRRLILEASQYFWRQKPRSCRKSGNRLQYSPAQKWISPPNSSSIRCRVVHNSHKLLSPLIWPVKNPGTKRIQTRFNRSEKDQIPNPASNSSSTVATIRMEQPSSNSLTIRSTFQSKRYPRSQEPPTISSRHSTRKTRPFLRIRHDQKRLLVHVMNWKCKRSKARI